PASRTQHSGVEPVPEPVAPLTFQRPLHRAPTIRNFAPLVPQSSEFAGQSSRLRRSLQRWCLRLEYVPAHAERFLCLRCPTDAELRMSLRRQHESVLRCRFSTTDSWPARPESTNGLQLGLCPLAVHANLRAAQFVPGTRLVRPWSTQPSEHQEESCPYLA